MVNVAVDWPRGHLGFPSRTRLPLWAYCDISGNVRVRSSKEGRNIVVVMAFRCKIGSRPLEIGKATTRRYSPYQPQFVINNINTS